jgi:outer membrane protein OmpA-like peptidoglycan-associated protein
MSGATSRFSVPGEDLSPVVAGALAVIGVACAAGTVATYESPAAQGTPAALAVPTVAAVASALTPVVGPASAPAALASASPAAATACPPLVLNFRTGSAAPGEQATERLKALALWCVAHPTVVVTIDGHADATGSEDANLRLSRQRASSVAAVLAAGGVPKGQITVRGFGSFWPVDQSPADASWNRRVVVHTKGADCPRSTEEVVDP